MFLKNKNSRVLFLQIILVFLLIPLTSCAFKMTVHHAPEVRGKMIDLDTMRPAEGVSVGFLNFENQSMTDDKGEFHLDAVSEEKYFQLLLPGSSFRDYSLVAIQDQDTVAFGWASSVYRTGSTPPQSEIVIFIIKPESDDDLISDSQLKYIAQISKRLEDSNARSAIVEAASPDYNRLRESVETILNIIPEKVRNTEISETKLSEPFYHLFEIIPQ